MNVIIHPGKLKGTVEAVSSKSFAHRQITAAMLSDAETEITIKGFSDDIMRTLSCVEALGGRYITDGDKVKITPINKKAFNAVLDCGESGTTARIMLPVCTVAADSATITGSGRLPERPFSEITQLLRSRGSSVSSDCIPISVSGMPEAGEFPIPGNISSQYITGLMLTLPLLSADSKIILTTPLKSAAYVDITIDVLKGFGVNITKSHTGYNVPASGFHTPGSLIAEGDWSNAAFWVVAKTLGSEVTITNLNSNSVQGDRHITEVLEATTIDVDEIPDLFPVLAVLAAWRNGKTTLCNASRLRLKESDRIEAVYKMLKALGGEAEAGEDYLTVYGTGRLKGGTVDGCNDHRIVMSAAIAATICTGSVTIRGAEAVNKSYPSFFEDYKRLGGDVNVL